MSLSSGARLDGQWIAFVSMQSGFTVHRKRASGLGETEQVFTADPRTKSLSTHDWSVS